MMFKLFKSVSDVLISFPVVLFRLGENLRYTRIPQKALLPHMSLYKWIALSNDHG